MMDETALPARPKGPWPKLTEAERAEMMAAIMDNSPYEDAFWIFGFGSLMWNPGVEAVESSAATVHGYERKFHIWSSVGRGTPEWPGLGLCLEPTQGSCRGIAYRLNMTTLDADLDYLWDREMGSGVYRPTWVSVEMDDGPERQRTALTFVINPGHAQHAGPMPLEQMALVMSGACGKYGRCRDYLAQTIDEMAKLGERDPMLDELLERIDAGPS